MIDILNKMEPATLRRALRYYASKLTVRQMRAVCRCHRSLAAKVEAAHALANY